METVHKTASRPWISKRINVAKFLQDWTQLLEQKKLRCSNLRNEIGSEDYLNIEKECSEVAMRCPNQHSIEIGPYINAPENINLETLRLQQQDLERRKNDSQYESNVYHNARYNNYPLYQNAQSVEMLDDDIILPIEEHEVVLTVQIFRPERKIQTIGVRNGARFPTFHIDQEFMVLGSQFLTELRDKIDCTSDKAIPGDFSENPKAIVDIICKDLYKSGFFFIDGTFYNDTRHPDCRDYSEIIINWARSKQRGIGPFHKCTMEDSKFMQLELQLGYPYVYVHQGNCEHFIVFTDLVMHGSHHRSNRRDYPLHVVLKPKKRIFCMVCHIHTAEWIVYNSKRVPETPFYFCKKCFLSFNYDHNDQKIEEFEAYRHIDRSTIL